MLLEGFVITLEETYKRLVAEVSQINKTIKSINSHKNINDESSIAVGELCKMRGHVESQRDQVMSSLKRINSYINEQKAKGEDDLYMTPTDQHAARRVKVQVRDTDSQEWLETSNYLVFVQKTASGEAFWVTASLDISSPIEPYNQCRMLKTNHTKNI